MATNEHQELANFIKSVHQNLRLQSRALGPQRAWENHCQQTSLLQKYAEFMHKLATTFWNENNQNNSEICRIHWVVHQVLEYFINGGLEKAYEREFSLNIKYFGVFSEHKMSYVKGDKINLLDVGSCYNPFKKFPIFNVTAVDLIPATEDVLHCDFLSVDIVGEETVHSSPCTKLTEASFDVIVFSLLLEYLPSSEQRYICCLKAYKLLKPDGLLCILSPDSKHATANSKVMKSWRYCLASMGLWRIVYQKLKHLHCMVYRKCRNPELAKHWLSLQCQNVIEVQEMMFIPQDFHEYSNKTKVHVDERSELDNEEVVYNFNALSEVDVFN